MTVASISRESAVELYDFCTAHSLKEFFVAKDQGVYIGANIGSTQAGTLKNSIHYLDGMNPSVDGDDWYDNAGSKFGYDDFGEHLPIEFLEVFLTDPGYVNQRRFSLKIGKRKITLI